MVRKSSRKVSDKKGQRELLKEARKFLSLPDLFPKSKINSKRLLTQYQKKKIRRAIDEIKSIGGEYARDIVPMGKGRKTYLEKAGLPTYMRGIFLPGGQKVNKKVSYVGGAIRYERGGHPRERWELDTSGDDEDLIKSTKKILSARKGRKAAITANGRAIAGAYPLEDDDTIITEAAYIFNKYAGMAEKGKSRYIAGNRRKKVLAAHPNNWGMGVLFEGGVKENGKNKKAKSKKRR